MSDVPAGRVDERLLFRDRNDGGTPSFARKPPLIGIPSGLTPGAFAGRHQNVLAAARRTAAALSEAARLEAERGTGFLLVPVGLAIGAFVYFRLPFEPPFLAIAIFVSIAWIASFAISSAGPARFATVAALTVALGMLAGKIETWRVDTKMLGGEVATRITGQVADIERLANGRARLTIDVSGTARPKLRYAPERVRATARKIPDGLRAGSTIEGLVRLRPPSGPVRPDSYDFSFESYFDGIGANGFFMSDPKVVVAPEAGLLERWAAHVSNLRNDVAARIRQRIGGAEGEIAAALMVGVRAGIPDDVSEALRRTGLYHVISISGLHMALVAGVVVGAVRMGFALFPVFSSYRPARKFAAAAGLAAIASYLLISGGEVAAQRSFLMLAVMLAAVLFDRAALTMRNLAISAIVVIAVTPHEVIGPSFQMSFAATAALVAAYAVWKDRAHSDSAMPATRGIVSAAAHRIGGLAIGLALTSLVAGLATATYGAYHFQRVAPLSLVANLVAMPIVSIAVVPSALLAAAAMPFGLDGPLLDVMGRGIAAMIAVAEWFSKRSPVDAIGLVPGSAVLFVTAALVVVTVTTTRLRIFSLPFALAGLLTIGSARTPDIFVSEDATLVGYARDDTTLAVNRTRPNGFTVENWQRSLARETLDTPRRKEGSGVSHPGFRCGETTCVAIHPSAAQIVHTAELEDARRACTSAAVIVLDDPTLPLKCSDPTIVVLTKRDLATHGSAAIFLSDYPGAHAAEVSFAIDTLDRPWHRHRQFSREARGLAPYRSKGSKAKTDETKSVPQENSRQDRDPPSQNTTSQ